MDSSLGIKNFSRSKIKSLEIPGLTDFQLTSFNWFIKEGIKEVFDELTPIFDYTQKELKLEFLDCHLEEPKLTEKQAKEKKLNYEASLRVKLKITNLKNNTTKEQEVYFGDIPVMTNRSTFIINGIEKVVISQIIRSAGVYFSSVNFRGKKLFGAKVIPLRGAWLEFETDSDGAIEVKIDRKRKVAATELLKIFGLETTEQIKQVFKEEESKNYLEATLKKTTSTSLEEAYIEVYRRLRPGELPTYDSAHDLINNMFFRLDRYDLAKVGRYKLNQRLNLNKDISKRQLDLEDLIAIIKEIIKLNNDPKAKDDDIDHLGNRRLRAVGEILQDRFRVGLMRMSRTIKDRMAQLDPLTITPAALINPRVLISAFREFFNVSQLCQLMNQINLLSELEHKRKITPMGPGGLVQERAGIDVRDIHQSHYGRLCPIQTPEGKNIGLVLTLSLYARLNEFGFIETPYFKVRKGVITPEIVWLNAFEESKYKIAYAGIELDEKGRIKDDWVGARVNLEPTLVKREEIDLIDVSPQQIISAAVALIPFLEHDESNRALMGANMQRQAVPCVKPKVPLVSTGLEEKIAHDSGQCLISEGEGIVEEVDANHIVVRTSNGEKKNYRLVSFERSNENSCLLQKPIVKKGEKVLKGQVLADGAATENGATALGQNLLVALIPFYGANYEDAIVVSERILKEDRFSSIHIEEFNCDVVDTKLGPEITTYDIPNVSEEKLKNLDEEGIIRIGAEVKAGDILVGKVSPKGRADLTPEERLLQAIFGEETKDVKDTSLLLEPSREGRVIRTKILSRQAGDKLDVGVIKKISVEVAELRKLRTGDKLSGRHGNKGVISIIVPEEDMPYLEDGTPVDIVLNPLGVVSRMNLGQIFEMHLGWAASKLKYRAVVPSLDGPTSEEIKEELIKAGLPEDGHVVLYNGKTGEPFDKKVGVGIMYLMKLDHMVEDIIHMRAVGPYSLITQQPLGGRAHFGGQRFGEMEVWALEGYGASYTLQEMLTIKSDDVLGRASAYEAIINGEKIKNLNIPAAFNVILKELQSLALSINLIKSQNP
ncbi:MAG TPA: DNA-directed RNA polymerase subunit beta [Candidatus Paceibacterota bacterium]|nr:DNA-directed RNA polymerase subunit beta [Candidatus Paceibacterota bacterium]HOK97286.1 DNA-directed RNA polymerase subunit beta [Candidatus Paceibacterota bacterium]HPP64722.1 DNA-directed RNA polymerase subunit beta [Candidatus Paceibacterota bacterium]